MAFIIKTKKLKSYMEKISDSNDESAAEEREILSKLTQECMNYYKEYFKVGYEKKLKTLIINDTQEIIKKLKVNSTLINANEIRERIKREIKDMNFFNIILIGNTGVGKSTLINAFLHLKNNFAKEGDTATPQKIDNWPKKYPVSEKDSDISGINLYDTEGIEKTGTNNFKNHLDNIVDFIHNPRSDLKEKINAIWYCINNNRLDGDEDYINEIFKLFSGLKIPIIFIFTKAYRTCKKEIKMIQAGLNKFEHFQKNPQDLHFKQVVAKELIDEDSGEVIEPKKGLDELLEETMKVSNNIIRAPIMKKISEIFNESSMNLIEKLSKKLQEQYNEIISNHDKLKTFDKKFYEIFETIYGDTAKWNKSFIEGKIAGWMKILEDIQKNELKQAIKNYTNTLLMGKLENFIKSKYDEKKKKNENLPKARQFNQEYKKYKEDINDYLVKQINNSKEIYGIYSLFDAVRDSMFEQIFADLENNLNKNKIETQVDLEKTIIPQKIEELKKKVMNKI